jgi:hypothetical protein
MSLAFFSAASLPGATKLAPANTTSGYVARVLINETPFPGERFWVSEQDTRNSQTAIIWVLRHRLRNIPAGYTQKQVAAVTTDDVIDIITAGGVRGQVDGFYRDNRGRPAMSDRIDERVDHLLSIANKGQPGRFSRLLEHAQKLADDFAGENPEDRFEDLKKVDNIAVTGSAYGWMTDLQVYNIGGNFVRISDQWHGGMGGNRFFTLRLLP